MGQDLTYSGCKWLNQNEIDNFFKNSISEDSLDGHILKVDPEYFDE